VWSEPTTSNHHDLGAQSDHTRIQLSRVRLDAALDIWNAAEPYRDDAKAFGGGHRDIPIN
jgi:hypothetical protein